MEKECYSFETFKNHEYGIVAYTKDCMRSNGCSATQIVKYEQTARGGDFSRLRNISQDILDLLNKKKEEQFPLMKGGDHGMRK